MAILHRTHTLTAVVPRYVERFRCIGPDCEDTCCASWSIHIDKKTYEAYGNAAAPELGKMLAQHLIREDGSLGDAKYARIQPEGKEKRCPLMQGGLCTIHKELGESYISNLCFSYPRTTRTLAGQLEQSLSLSCPEAARLALLAEDAFEFTEADIAVRIDDVKRSNTQQDEAAELMNEVRIFCMNLLRTRELPLWKRLAALGVFCAALSSLCAQGKQTAIPQLISDFIQLIENGALLSSLNDVQANYNAQAMVFSTLWAAKGFNSPSDYQQAVIQQISRGLGGGANGKASGTELAAAYSRGLARLEESLKDAPFLLENYLINEMFSTMFPFEAADPYDSYLRLVSRFCLLRLLLAAQCSTSEQVPPSLLVATVQLHCRWFQHDATYMDRVNLALKDSEWANLDKLHSLIRT